MLARHMLPEGPRMSGYRACLDPLLQPLMVYMSSFCLRGPRVSEGGGVDCKADGDNDATRTYSLGISFADWYFCKLVLDICPSPSCQPLRVSEGGGVDCKADGDNDARHQDVLVGDQIWRLVLLEEALLPGQLALALRLLLEQGRRPRSGCVPVLPE